MVAPPPLFYIPPWVTMKIIVEINPVITRSKHNGFYI